MNPVLLLLSVLACTQACYWNRQCPFPLHSTKTPYDTVRGDIRDFTTPQNCEAVSVWTLNRHGNRNPGSSVTESIKYIASLKDEIDVNNFRRWSWNDTLEVSQSYLTGTGYEELFDIATRIREKYPHLLQGTAEDYYFRPTNEQRTITSAIAFAHGLNDGTNLTLHIDNARTRDDVVRPYENCDRYQQEVKTSQLLDDQMNDYFNTAEFIAVQHAVQQRLGLSTQLTPDNIYELYEICRFDRSWSDIHQSPWCAAFSDHDLVVLEYRDDIRHYYRNGYGSWVNVNLGGPALKDLYENFEAAVQGHGRKVTSYFTHDTMLEMVWCALGIFKDPNQLQASFRNPGRVWRTSSIGAFSVNLIAVLNR
ncbi:putative multiple inositol polyphosphate phosphatase [Operophtera brumata]|uniref:Multiple inositol polyphosphate phosphatase 1 n=1 Tax=Operophtera brumata TaxID=104452 RepID=A0A0L7KTC5_OPEBR|nr:putative multiple inositol polyphosphate phosphatase [Operophtera brumata]